MNVSLSQAKKLARMLLKQNDSRSWRQIAQQDYCNRVNYATLNRIANSKGTWLPKDPEILTALGLLKPRSPFAVLPKWFDRTPEALAWFNGQREKVKGMGKETRDFVKASRTGKVMR